MILTQPPIRSSDRQGSGYYGAPRGKYASGKPRFHKGVDFACYPGTKVYSPVSCTVQRLGYPYSPADPRKGHLRLVQVEDSRESIVRFLYVEPMVKPGDTIKPGDLIGITQELGAIYSGITEHFHFDVKMLKPGGTRRSYVDPVKYLNGEI